MADGALRQVGKVRLNAEMLGMMLGLPDGHRVIGVEVSNDPIAVWVMIEGDSMPYLIPDSEAYVIGLSGRTSVTWEVDPDAVKADSEEMVERLRRQG